MRFREIHVEREGALRRSQTAVSLPAEVGLHSLRAGHQRPGAGIIRVDLDRALTQSNHGIETSRVAEGQILLLGHQHESVGVGVARAALCDGLLLVRQQLESHRPDDRLRDLVLQGEDVVQVAVVALGPDVIAARAFDQLGGDAHALAGLAHAALEHMTDLELPRDLGHVDVFALERKGRIAGDHRKRGDLAQVGGDVFADAVAEILLLGIAAHVDERQHADGDPGRAAGTRLPRAACVCRCAAGFGMTREHCAERAQEILALRAGGALAPAIEVGRVDRAHVDWQAGAVETDRHQHPAVSGFPGFATHPARRHRLGRPDDQHGAGRGELGADLVVEFLAGSNVGVPPDGPPLGLDRGDERCDECFVGAGVGDEDIGHSARTLAGMPARR